MSSDEYADAPDQLRELTRRLDLTRHELTWTRREQEQQAEALQRVRRQRTRLREQSAGLADALAAELSAAYWSDQGGLLRRRSAESELVRELEASELFDAGWYLLQHQSALIEERMSPALHHVRHANARRLDPSKAFDTARYLLRRPEAKESGVPALLHAERNGFLDDGLSDVGPTASATQ